MIDTLQGQIVEDLKKGSNIENLETGNNIDSWFQYNVTTTTDVINIALDEAKHDNFQTLATRNDKKVELSTANKASKAKLSFIIIFILYAVLV